MFDGMVFGDWLTSLIRMGVSSFIEGKFSGLGDAVHTLLASGLILTVIIIGVRTMAGDMVGSMKDLAKLAGWVILSVGITEPSTYNWLIIEPLYQVKDGLTAYIMTGDSRTTMYQAFSDTNGRVINHAYNITQAADWTDVTMWLTAIVIYIVYGLYYVFFIGVTSYCELAMGVMLLFGSLILPISSFPSCRQLAKSWTVALLKYFAVFVVISFCISLLNLISDIAIDKLMAEVYGTSSSLDSDNVGMNSPIFGGVLIIGVFGIYMLFQAMEFASELTGGVMSDGAKGVSSIANSASVAARGIGAGSRGLSAGIKGLKAKTGG